MGIKNVVLGIAILVLTISVVVYGISTVYDGPKYYDFCEERTGSIIEDPIECEAAEGQWNVYDGPKSSEVGGWCDSDFTCSAEYEDAREKYSRNLFLITLPIGIAIIIAGAVVFGLEAVGAGLMGGGVGVILYGVGEYWRYSGDLLKFLLSLVGLIVVIWFSYRFNRHKKN